MLYRNWSQWDWEEERKDASERAKATGERAAEEMEGPWEMTKLSMDGILVGGAPTVPNSDTRALRI